eukprot:4745450-Prymnesium_polylepis.2
MPSAALRSHRDARTRQPAASTGARAASVFAAVRSLGSVTPTAFARRLSCAMRRRRRARAAQSGARGRRRAAAGRRAACATRSS